MMLRNTFNGEKAQNILNTAMSKLYRKNVFNGMVSN